MTSPSPEAESLFADFLARRAGGEDLDFETWVREQSAHASELRALFRVNRELSAKLGSPQPTHAKDRKSFFRSKSAGDPRVPDPASSSTGAIGPGVHIGDFRLLWILGSGGMGQVWEAEELSLGRRVALKLIRRGSVDATSLELFAREARAGGRLAHPGIVSVHATGETDGVHWINQELVEGGWTLRDFIDDTRNAESLPEHYYTNIAEFAILLADALDAAHSAGVIHRDIKPQNILITPDDHPKLTDFGLARITDESALTLTGEFAGTYLYMSPEQVAARRMGIDHRSDIFSFGVVLYELLALQRPFEGDTTHQIAEKILTWDPPDLTRLRSRLPLELAVIAGKALEKRPADRYPSMGELAADLRRYLADEPILARPPGPLRRTAKWALRNPVRSTAATIGALALMIISGLLFKVQDERDKFKRQSRTLGIALADLSLQEQATRERSEELSAKNEELTAAKTEIEQQRDLVTGERDRLETVVEFQKSLFDELDPEYFGSRLRLGAQEHLSATLEGRGRDAGEIERALEDLRRATDPVNFTTIGVEAIREAILNPATTRIASTFGGDLLTKARLQDAIADAFERLGLYKPALTLRRESLVVYRERLGVEDRETLTSMSSMGVLLESMGELDQALPFCEASLAGRRLLLGPEHPSTLVSMSRMGSLLDSMGKPEQALPYYEAALEGSRRVLGDDEPQTLQSLNDMGYVLDSMGKPEQALPYYEAALEGSRRVLGDDHPQTLQSLNNMGYVLYSMGQFNEAYPYFEAALRDSRRVLGDNHPDTLTSVINMGGLLESMGKPDEALSYYEQALEGSRRVLGDDHPRTLISVNNMGHLLHSMGKLEAAFPYYEEALEGNRSVFGNEHPSTLISMNNMGYVLQSMGKLDEARPFYEEALALGRRVRGDDHPETLISVSNMGDLLQSMGKFDEALPYREEALAGSLRVHGQEHPSTFDSLNKMGHLLRSMGKLEEALPYYEQALSGRGRLLGDEHPDTLRSVINTSSLLIKMGRLEPARDLLKPARTLAVATLPADHRIRRALTENLARCYEAMHEKAPDAGWEASAVQLRKELSGSGD